MKPEQKCVSLETAKRLKEASKQEPQEVYIADEWSNKVGFLTSPTVNGIESKK